jgi:atypical dual specificity phosphatase
MWEWTLNWNEIRGDLVIGSCPVTTADIDRLRRETRATAMPSLQHPDCWAHFGIDYAAHRAHGRRAGLAMANIPLRDFDPADQRARLPEAVRCLRGMLAAGHRVYVHCSAGFNRAPLVVLAYLALVEGMAAETALECIRRGRPEAAPYWDAYVGCRRDLVALLEQDIRCRAFHRSLSSPGNDAETNWLLAEAELLREQLEPVGVRK